MTRSQWLALLATLRDDPPDVLAAWLNYDRMPDSVRVEFERAWERALNRKHENETRTRDLSD